MRLPPNSSPPPRAPQRMGSLESSRARLAMTTDGGWHYQRPLGIFPPILVGNGTSQQGTGTYETSNQSASPSPHPGSPLAWKADYPHPRAEQRLRAIVVGSRSCRR